MKTIEETARKLRPELKLPLPARIAELPIFRGYPVPWFVAWPGGEPEFRAANGVKWWAAVQHKLCWVCGKQLGAYLAFVLGPMCGISRTTAEPACHRDCAEWSIQNCPFLSRPKMVRRENDLPEGVVFSATGLKRNPRASLLWITRDFKPFQGESGEWLITVGDPLETVWFYEGRMATRAEVDESVAEGMPDLEAMAALDGERGLGDLAKAVAKFQKLLPA